MNKDFYSNFLSIEIAGNFCVINFVFDYESNLGLGIIAFIKTKVYFYTIYFTAFSSFVPNIFVIDFIAKST